MKVDIIAGFLGAGKTTFINKLLDEAYFGEKVALLENEFGEIALDGALLSEHHIAIREMANGCICGTLQGNFINGIMDLAATYRPQRLIIEPTGLAKLSDVYQACRYAAAKTPLMLNAVITVVDATMLPVFMEVGGEFFQNQISEAKTILLSHLEEMEEGDSFTEVLQIIKKLNPQAPVFAKPWENLHGLEVLTIAEEVPPVETLQGDKSDVKHPNRHDHEPHHDHEHEHHHDQGVEGFTSYSSFLKESYTDAGIKGFIQRLKEGSGGTVFQAKGLFNTPGGNKRLDYVYGKAKVELYPFRGEGRMVIIGKEIDSQYWQDILLSTRSES